MAAIALLVIIGIAVKAFIDLGLEDEYDDTVSPNVPDDNDPEV
jgi:hypothetical protein